MKFYFRGTKIIAQKKSDRLKELATYMLVESLDSNYFFQLVCISGYNSGFIFGYIRKDPEALKANCIAVSCEFLLEQIEYNLGEVVMETYEVIP